MAERPGTAHFLCLAVPNIIKTAEVSPLSQDVSSTTTVDH
jgi:hypothetical protein